MDLRLLLEASKRLHGCLVHDCFSRYLGDITASFERLCRRGYLGAGLAALARNGLPGGGGRRLLGTGDAE